MSWRKIRDLDDDRCGHPDHNPPSMVALKPGVYRHECPNCGWSTTAIVPRVML